MAAELFAEIESVPEAPELGNGWRGLIDFGERWTVTDTDLAWPPGSGKVPLGEPVVYGCEVTYQVPDSHHVRIRFISLDSIRPVMASGAGFALRDGGTVRATGRVT